MFCLPRASVPRRALFACAFVASWWFAFGQALPATATDVPSEGRAVAARDAETARRPYGLHGLSALGQTGGYAGVSASDGRLVVLGVGPRLYVLDLLFPDEPMIVGQTDLLGGVVTDATMADGKAFLAAGLGGLVVVDLTDPTTPRITGHLETFGQVHGVAVEGNQAFLLHAFSEMLVVDVTDAAAPRQIGAMAVDGGVPASVAAAPGYAYLAAREDPWTDGRLHVISTADPTRPTQVGVMPTDGSSSDVAVAGDHVYLADGDAGLLVIDVSDPRSPQRVGQVAPDWFSESVKLFGDTAYVTDFAFGLQIVDITTPATAVQIGWLDLPSGAEDVAVYEDYAYIADGSGLQVADVSDAALPAISGAVDIDGPMLAEAVVTQGAFAYVGDDFRGLSVVSVQDPRQPREVGLLPLDLPAADIAVHGDLAYLASGRTTFDGPADGRVTVVSVGDPAAPALLAEITPGGSSSGVAAADGLLYVGDGSNGLRVYDVSEPRRPREIGALTPNGIAFGRLHLDRDRNLILATSGVAGIAIVDVSDSASPRLASSLGTPGDARDITSSGGIAYLAAGTDGLRVLDVSDPAAPIEIASFNTDSFAQGVAVVDDQVVVADGGGLVLVDVSDPRRPQGTDSIALADSARSVALRDGVTYVAADAAGLYTVRGAGTAQSVWLPLALRGAPLDG